MKAEMVETDAGESIRISLFDPGMTPIHRAGLAGLAMTLRRLDPKECPTEGKWVVKESSVELLAEDTDALIALIAWVFEQGLRVDDQGLIDFLGLVQRGRKPTPQSKLIMQQALRGTFLQHGRSRKKEGSTRQMQLDPDATKVTDTYEPLVSYVHQSAWEKVAKELSRKRPKLIDLVGWFLPGAVEKHPGTKKTRMEATIPQFIALQFAMVGCISFRINNRTDPSRQRFALVIPEIDDLDAYDKLRMRATELGPRELTAASAEDAALQVALLADDPGVRQAMRKLGRNIFCTAVAFGVQKWATQQKTRTSVIELEMPSGAALHNYRLARDLFPSRTVARKDEKGTFIATSAAMSAISTSLAHRRAWYDDLAKAIRKRPDFRKALNYSNERRGLAAMVKEAQWEHERERLFVEACHAAMKQIYGSIGRRTTAAGSDFGRKAEVEMTHIRSSLLRAKNADNFRDVLAEFWAKASRDKIRSNRVLKTTVETEKGEAPVWQHILPLLDDKHWRKARDLALLALVSYASSGDEDEEEPEALDD